MIQMRTAGTVLQIYTLSDAHVTDNHTFQRRTSLLKYITTPLIVFHMHDYDE